MGLSFMFFFNSIFLGVGLAMDAFSVSLANGLNEPQMKKRRMVKMAMVFAGFQALMPLLGWICVSTIMKYFLAFEKLIPWIALVLLCYIGISMLFEGIAAADKEEEKQGVGLMGLLVQGVATSIDALSVGFTIAEYKFAMALICTVIIAVVTFFICMGGLYVGRRFGTKLSNKATIFGGVILIFIGIEIFISGIF